jgi:heat shock protein beta
MGSDQGSVYRLNISRETLQANKFIQQLKSIIVRKALDLFTRLSKDDVDNFKRFSEVYGTAMRVGILETSSKKDTHKLASLLRFSSTRSDFTSLDEVSGKASHSHVRVAF